MATSNDHPGLPFVQAAGYTRGRPDGPPLWIVVHDMEAGEHSDRAENTAAYFADPSDGRQVSSHYCVDDNSVIQCVDLDDVAWTVGNRPGNNRGINWELSGFARQTREEWLDPFGVAMFAQMAPYVRADATRFGIPLTRCSIDDLRVLKPGITSHNDLRLAFGVTDHTDPGPNFPWDYFLNVVNGVGTSTKETDMFRLITKDPDPSKNQFVIMANPLSPTGFSYVTWGAEVQPQIRILTDSGAIATVDARKEPNATDAWLPTAFGPPTSQVRGQFIADTAAAVIAQLPAGAVDVEELARLLAELLPTPLDFSETKQAAFEAAQEAENR